MTSTLKEDIEFFSNYMSIYKAKKFVNNIITFSIDYSTNNNILFLKDEIYNTKKDKFKEIFSKNNFLKDSLKKKVFTVDELINLPPAILEPEKYNSILNKKRIEEHRINNEPTSDAFTCKKCNSKKSKISERQTRSGDEPATVFVTCVACGFSFTM